MIDFKDISVEFGAKIKEMTGLSPSIFWSHLSFMSFYSSAFHS